MTRRIDEGGEAPCFAHLSSTTDIAGRVDLRRLIVNFYRDVAMDNVLGPAFAAARVDWSAHIPKLIDFWAWQLLGDPAYDRNPLRAHEPVHAHTPFADVHYQRWLELFETHVDRLFAGPVADQAKQRARKMAAAMRRLLDGESAAAADAPVGVSRASRPAAGGNAVARLASVGGPISDPTCHRAVS